MSKETGLFHTENSLLVGFILISLYLLAIYDVGGILPLDIIFQIPGVGRPTDLFGMALAIYLVLTAVSNLGLHWLDRRYSAGLRGS